MIHFPKSIIFITLLLTLSNSYSSLTSLQDLAADKTIEALLSQTSQEEVSAVISSIPQEVQQKLKGKLLEKYKDILNKALAIQPKKLKIEGHANDIVSVAFSPCGKRALTGSVDGVVRLWNLTTITIIKEFKGHTNDIESVAFSPCGNRALTGSRDKTACLWNLATGTIIKRLKGHSREICSVAFSPCGNFALTGSGDETACLWDLASGTTIQEFKVHNSWVNSVSFSPCGKYVLTGSLDNSARLWDLATGTTIKELKGHSHRVYSVAFSPCGKYALTGSHDNTARLWDLTTGITIRELKGHTVQVRSVAFSPCGNFALTGSYDNTARLWDLVTGTTILKLEDSMGYITSLAFSPCGKYALIGAGMTAAPLWSLPHLDTLSLKQLLFILRFPQKTINLGDKDTQSLLNSLSSTLDPYGILPTKDYTINPLVKAYIDFRRKQLFCATANDDIDTVKALVKKGFNTVYTIDKAGDNLWHYAFRGHIENGSICPSKKVLAYLLEVEGKNKGLIKPNKVGLYPFAVGLFNNKEFTAKFIKGLSEPETKKSYCTIQ
ncbi:WD40 repeat domain-containing protein [Candidatus Dependentiae bacterium]|nr:WD40 repeat domain-containing protein [Candidatus Dependentiae bacterium]